MMGIGMTPFLMQVSPVSSLQQAYFECLATGNPLIPRLKFSTDGQCSDQVLRICHWLDGTKRDHFVL